MPSELNDRQSDIVKEKLALIRHWADEAYLNMRNARWEDMLIDVAAVTHWARDLRELMLVFSGDHWAEDEEESVAV